MQELTDAQKGRVAIRAFKTVADALALRGFYKPNGTSGQTLENALRLLSPEIYGSMNDPRVIELNGLEYVLDRLPRGIEKCTRIILTAEEEFENTSFEKILPLKRRRTSYRVSEKEICFVITRGLSEIYDILTHLTFLNIEARKIEQQMWNTKGEKRIEWKDLEEHVHHGTELGGGQLDKALWDLSILLGSKYQEVKETYEYLEKNKQATNSNNGLFRIIYGLGKRIEEEKAAKNDELLVYFTPALRDMIGIHKSADKWARDIKEKLCELKLRERPLHIISANLHSVVNILYGYACTKSAATVVDSGDVYSFFKQIRDKESDIKKYAEKYGLYQLPDNSGSHIDCQIVDTAKLESVELHPEVRVDESILRNKKPVILVMDYAFGTQAFEVMDALLMPLYTEKSSKDFNVDSISVMGKAGILPGKKGDIMLATAHVIEGTADNYIVQNDLTRQDFDSTMDVYVGPILTVLGTSLQNKNVLERFQSTSWNAVGLEMEGGHYQRAINAAIIRGHISSDIKVRYAYYASDNPLTSGETLASGGIGVEGIRSTYMITKTILEKILN
ncbi:DUF6909 family protein [Thermodesulfobacteriota bacterium]